MIVCLMKYILCILLFPYLVISCSQEKSTHLGNEFLAFIHSIEEVKSSQNIIAKDSNLQVVMHLFTTSSGRIIVVEGQSWNLHLKDKEGNAIAVAGGYGRGPGEFELINHAYLSDDDVLHILDSRLMRVTKYSFHKDQPELMSVTNLPNYEMRLEKFFPLTDGNYVGVFSENLPRTAGSFYNTVYHLDENYEQTKKVNRFFGGEMISLRGSLIVDELSARSVWLFYKDKLFYSRSDSFQVRMVSSEEDYLIQVDSPLNEIPAFRNDEYIQNNIGIHLENIFSMLPEFKVHFEELETFTYFTQVLIENGTAYFNIFNPVGSPGIILKYNLETSETTFIRTPPMFDLKQVFDNEIFGIDQTKGVNEIVSIRF